MVGATYPKELAEIRAIAGDMPILIAGIGAQGGSVEEVMKAGLNSKKAGLIINSSRSIIYASGGKDFPDKARSTAQELKNMINTYRLNIKRGNA
jgi:orotidine-5'-phosphate decarboxylase